MSARLALFAILVLFAANADAVPPVQHWVLDNGARVYFVESHEIPMVQITAAFDAGSARDTPAKSGLAMLTNAMLSEGAGKLDADRIAIEFERYGAQYGAEIDRDMAKVTLRSVSERELLQPALDLLATVLAQPTFPDDALARERTRALIGLQQEQQSPAEVAEKAFYQAVYGAHPYALHPNGTQAGLKAVARADLAAFHAKHYVGANAVLALVGDLTRPQAERLAQRLLGRLPAGAAAPPLPPVGKSAGKKADKTLRFPSAQSHILAGEPGMSRTDRDYFPLLVGNYTLGGGGLVSRLSEEIREKQGLSYSAYSYFNPLAQPGPFVMGAQTKNTQREQALKSMRMTVADFVATGPTPVELEAAKKHLSGSFPLRIDSNRKIGDYLAIIGFYRLPLTYLDDFVPQVDAVTIEQIRDAFRRRVHPAQMATVIVGGDGD
jgi:zinc protease